MKVSRALIGAAAIIAASGMAGPSGAQDPAPPRLGLTQAETQAAQRRVAAANIETVRLLNAGEYGAAQPRAERALALARDYLGPRHPDTLVSMNNLAFLYRAQGDYTRAQLLLEETLSLTHAVLGPRHPDTLISMHNLAELYKAQGDYTRAQPLYEEALALMRAVLGPRHPDTLISMGNLAALHDALGDIARAQPLLEETLALMRAVLGPRHFFTLTTMNNLAGLYQDQGDTARAQSLSEEVLSLTREVRGPHHPSTLVSMNNLAKLYESQGDYVRAQPLYEETLSLMRAVLGPRHPNTLTSMDNLASLYQDQGDTARAQRLLEEALALSLEVLGPRHPNTLISMGNLALLYNEQGDTARAQPLYEETLALRRAVLGPRHPNTLTSMSNLAALRIGLFRRDGDPVQLSQAAALFGESIALRQGRSLRQMQSTRSREGAAAALRGNYDTLSASLSLAAQHTGPHTTDLAARAVLAFKTLRGEYRARLRQFAQTGGPEARRIAESLRTLPARMEEAEAVGELEEAQAIWAQIGDLEGELAALAPDFETLITPPSPAEIAALLPPNAALIEYQFYHSLDFATGKWGEHRLAAMVLRPEHPPAFFDLGPASPILETLRFLTHEETGVQASHLREDGKYEYRPTLRLRHRRHALRQAIFTPLEEALAGADRLIVAPDGALHALPFALLTSADGKGWMIDDTPIELVPTGRDLRPRSFPEPAARAMLFGDPNFGAPDGEAQAPVPADCHFLEPRILIAFANLLDSRAGTLTPLPGTRCEVQAIQRLLEAESGLAVDGPHLGDDASEAAIRAISQPPHILHLSTHGQIDKGAASDADPLRRVALFLAHANRRSQRPGEDDGVLSGADIAELSLNGTRLATLSACQSGLGDNARDDGLMSLAYAFRLAGVRNTLMTYWKVSDAGAARFMRDFYREWLSRPMASPHQALLAVQRRWRAEGGHPAIWAAFAVSQNQPLGE